MRTTYVLLASALVGAAVLGEEPALRQPVNSWVKRGPLPDAPRSPGLGYEASFGYDPVAKVVIRWAGHNQGGGGEQNAETWTYDPATAKWTLKEPNTSPPGVCCAQQNVFDTDRNRFLRFAGFSGNHGWQWFREIYLNNSSVWSYDLKANTWRDLRTVPAPRVSPLRCAAWDSDHQVVVVFGGEGSTEGTVVFDPYTNTWTRMNPAEQPKFRSSGNLAYDEARKVHILFGAQFTDDPHTWAYDLPKNVWRDMKPGQQPPTDRNDAVLAYDGRNQIVIASVRRFDKADGKEVGQFDTWAYDAGKNVWTAMKPDVEPPGGGNRRRILAYVPDENVVVMENFFTHKAGQHEQQMWTYRYAEPKEARTLPPTEVKVTTTADGATLSWRPSTSEGVRGYIIHRGEGPKPWLVKYQAIGNVDKNQTTFRDRELQPGTVYYYRIESVAAVGPQSRPSPPVRTQPRVVEDVVVSMVSPREARLSWPAPPGDDLLGYHVERAPVDVFSEDQIVRLKTDTPPLAEPSVGGVRAIGAFVRLTEAPIKAAAFTDATLDLNKPVTMDDKPLFVHRFGAKQIDDHGKPYRFAVYAYRVRAVNRLGVEGGPGPYALTIPSAPQWLFSKEEGETGHLKWAANPEAKLKGYRVYRMESPRINGPGQKVTRVTTEPIAAAKYSDAQAGKVTRRYWVVAVDALGQEGFPSAPTWHARQYRKHYEPFTGEWHQ